MLWNSGVLEIVSAIACDLADSDDLGFGAQGLGVDKV